MKYCLHLFLTLFLTTSSVFAQEVILQDDFAMGWSSHFAISSSTQSSAIFTNQMVMLTGGYGTTWVGNGDATTAQNAWYDNNLSKAWLSGYVDASNYSSVELQVTFRQTASSSVKHSWFRILVNGHTQTALSGEKNFNPVTKSNDVFRTVVYNLNHVAGDDFVLSMQTSCKHVSLDATYIDEVRILYNNVESPKSLPYVQHFDSLHIPSSWYGWSDTLSLGWQFGNHPSQGIPPHGNYFAAINYASDTAQAVNSMNSPLFNFENLGSVSLSFDAFADHPFSVLLSADSGQTWTDTVATVLNTPAWSTQVVDLSSFAGQNYVRLGFANFDPNDAASVVAIDNFSLMGVVTTNFDLALSQVVNPTASPQFSVNEEVTIRIKNNSANAVSNFQVGMIVNDGFAYFDTITDAIMPSDSLDFTFANTVDMSVPGNYTIQSWVSKAYDANTANDTLVATLVSSYPTISSYPYLQSFESENFWVSGGQNSSWEWGIPNNSFIASAPSGQKAWVTNLSGTYNTFEVSWVRSPVFDFTNLNTPYLSFDLLFDCESFEDGACFQYSTDEGQTWTSLGSQGDTPNWYNSTFIAGLATQGTFHGWSQTPYTNWVQAEYDIAFLAGSTGVRFRFLFASTFNPNSREGFAFDDFRIYDIQGHDIGISALLSPTGDCAMTNAEPVVVEITNYGLNDVSGFEISYQLNNGIPVSEYVNDTIETNSSFTYVFNNTIDLSTLGVKKLFLSLSDTGDQASFNDTLTTRLNLIQSLGLPYYENFETTSLPSHWSLSQAPGSDGWLFGNNNSSTYFPVPPHGYYASSNDDTCYCDMSEDMLISPAFDLSLYGQVSLSFEAFLTGYNGSTGSVLASTDCGYTWTNIYFVPGNSQVWQNLSIDLSAYAGLNSVKIAFLHNDNGGWSAGFAIDNVYVTGTTLSQVQDITLKSGWGLMSSYINPPEPSIDSVFSPVVNNLVILKNSTGQVYWPAFGLNIIGNYDVHQGYQYKMSQTDTLHLVGPGMVPETTPFDIPQGWSIIAYLRNNPGVATSMMASVSSEIAIMKNGVGQVYWPAFGLNAIGDMEPGKGYQIKMLNGVVFSYPAN